MVRTSPFGARKLQRTSKITFMHDPWVTYNLYFNYLVMQVAELKATNNLYNDQDFHALKHIKIPIQPHSLLTERAEEERRRENVFKEQENDNENKASQDENSDSDYENTEQDSLTSSGRKTVRTVSISSNLKDPERFLKKMDDDLQKICQSVSFQKSDPNDINRRLTTQCIHPRTAKKKDSDELGIIWAGFGWKAAVFAFILIAIVVPILYFIYIEEIKS